MGDTIIISNPDSLQNLIGSFPPDVRDSVIKILHSTDDQATDTSHPFLNFILFSCIIIAVVYFKTRNKKSMISYTADDASIIETPAPDPEYYYYNGQYLNLTDTDIIPILQKHFVYYTCLSAELKERFLLRLKQFMLEKIFRLPKDETFKEIPVLLSAAAIQLTFGLDEFEFPWFQYINVNPEEYFADDPHALRILEGNVEDQSITIAWNYFLSGLNNSEDGANVGLHELAHALYYEYVVAENNSKKAFTKSLDFVTQEIDKIYNAGKTAQTLFSDYAFRNTQEFWAESIEIFFEKPAALQTEFPDLFDSIETLLEQNPLDKSNPLVES